MITAVESPLWLFLYRYSMQFGETLFPDKIISMLKDWKLNKTIQILYQNEDKYYWWNLITKELKVTTEFTPVGNMILFTNFNHLSTEKCKVFTLPKNYFEKFVDYLCEAQDNGLIE